MMLHRSATMLLSTRCVSLVSFSPRFFTSSRVIASGMDDFFAAPLVGDGPAPPVSAGRAWRAAELRGKSFEDLHGLWFVCLKERNLLLTERLYSRQLLQSAPAGNRLDKVKRTMGGIRVVLSERARAAEAAAAAGARAVAAAVMAKGRVGTIFMGEVGGGSRAGTSSSTSVATEEEEPRSILAREMSDAIDAKRARSNKVSVAF
jgi:hypothetical protein